MKTKKYGIRRATTGSAGYDFKVPESMTLVPGEWVKIDTGVAFDGTERITIPRSGAIGGLIDRILGVRHVNDWFMMIAPRSSLGMKYGMRFSNTVGIIDKDYRGNIMLEVTVEKTLRLEEGERIAQGILMPYFAFDDEIQPDKERTGGMGSTGRK